MSHFQVLLLSPFSCLSIVTDTEASIFPSLSVLYYMLPTLSKFLSKPSSVVQFECAIYFLLGVGTSVSKKQETRKC